MNELIQHTNTLGVAESLQYYGYARFDGMHSDRQLLQFAGLFDSVMLHRDADAHGVTQVSPRPAETGLQSSLGFTDQELQLHTDSTSMPYAPDFLVLYCRAQAPRGGVSRLLDGRKLYRHLARTDNQLLAKQTAPGSVVFGDPQGTHHVGSVFADDGDRTYVRFRADGGALHANLSDREQKSLTATMDALADEFTLTEGEGYIVDNKRTMHARTAFQGCREMRRVLIKRASTIPGSMVLTGFSAGEV